MAIVLNKGIDQYKVLIGGISQGPFEVDSSAPITISKPSLSISKYQSLDYIELNDEVEYTLTIQNTGDTPFASIQLRDAIPAGMTFIGGSFIVPPDFTLSGSDITTGVTLTGNLNPNTLISLKFKVRVTAIVPPNSFTNQGFATGYYRLREDLPIRNLSEASSNLTEAFGVKPEFSITKQVTPQEAEKNDEIQYNIRITNTGNTRLLSVILTDFLPIEVAYIANTLFINEIQQPLTNQNLSAGISLSDIGLTQSVNIRFSARVLSDDSDKTVSNIASAVADYKKNPLNPDLTTPSISSLPAIFTLRKPTIALVKSASTLVIDTVNDKVIYTIIVTNTSAFPLDKVIISDPIPTGMALSTDPGDEIRGTSNPLSPGEILPGANIVTGIDIGSLAIGASYKITFVTKVTSIPPVRFDNVATANFTYTLNGGTTIRTHSVDSNSITVYAATVLLQKTVTPDIGISGDILDVVLTITSISESQENIIRDLLPLELDLVDNTVIINDGPPEVKDIINGFDLGAMAANTTQTVKFKVKIR